MSEYIISDLHFYHYNIIRYCKESRGQWLPKNEEEKPDVYSMNEYILKQFDELPEDSTIYNLGDILLNSNVTFSELCELIKRMKQNNKKLILIMGNHDREINRYLKPKNQFNSSYELLKAAGFDEVYKHPILLEGKYILSHEPIYLSPNSNLRNIYGHTHDILIDKDYFNRDCENLAMMERIKSEDTFKYSDKIINPIMYANVCWDNRKNIVKLEDILKEL